MIEIELGQSKHAVCDCCGKGTTSLTRFVYKDGDAHAIYYLAFAENHPERGADGVVSLGEWGVEGVAESRVAFGVKLWQSETENKCFDHGRRRFGLARGEDNWPQAE